MLRGFSVIFFLGLVLTLALAGFRGTTGTKRPLEIFPDMDDQPKYRPQHTSEFFADGRAARPPVAGTVPIGYTLPHSYATTEASNSRLNGGGKGFSALPGHADTGRIGGFWGDGIPVEVTAGLMERGRERFGINCAVCHGATGLGNGIVKQYGLTTVISLHDERIRGMPDGEIFNTITHGKNTMGAYGPQITVGDRWAIVAYLRALQRSQHAGLEDVPEEFRAQLDQPQPGETPK